MSEVRATSWLDVYLSDDVNDAVAKFTNKLTEIMNRHCPMKTIQIKKNYAPWLSDHLKECIHEKLFEFNKHTPN